MDRTCAVRGGGLLESRLQTKLIRFGTEQNGGTTQGGAEHCRKGGGCECLGNPVLGGVLGSGAKVELLQKQMVLLYVAPAAPESGSMGAADEKRSHSGCRWRA